MSVRAVAATVTVLWACAPAIAATGSAPCAERCTLELTNGTSLDLDVRVTQASLRAAADEHLGPGESRQIELASHETPSVTVVGARSASLATRLSVRVQCSAPTRSRDTFRSACRLASVSAVPGDSARDHPQRDRVQ
ncbi:MAG TPA: hypothetical protein VFZ56_05955 [Gemmatimonadaceae bacterium]